MCPGLSQLEIVCSSGESPFLEWNLTFPAVNGTFIRAISQTNVAGTVTPIQVGNIKFTFAITKHPLTSRVSSNLISPILNGSIIMCVEWDTQGIMGRSSEVVLHVVDTTAAGLCVSDKCITYSIRTLYVLYFICALY